jgi:hypothetical protein
MEGCEPLTPSRKAGFKNRCGGAESVSPPTPTGQRPSGDGPTPVVAAADCDKQSCAVQGQHGGRLPYRKRYREEVETADHSALQDKLNAATADHANKAAALEQALAESIAAHKKKKAELEAALAQSKDSMGADYSALRDTDTLFFSFLFFSKLKRAQGRFSVAFHRQYW